MPDVRKDIHIQRTLGIQDHKGHACDELLFMDMHEEGGKRERQCAGIMTVFTANENRVVRGNEYVRTDKNSF